MDKKLTWSVVVFLYVRAIAGLIIIFYPFQPTYLNAILSTIGALILFTSGLEIKFSHILKSVTKS